MAQSDERLITAETKLSDLTDLEIASLTADIKTSSSAGKPLVGHEEPIQALVEEYEGASTYLKKIAWLEANGWNRSRRWRGDGDCFYRSFAFAYIERLLSLPESSGSTQAALAKLDSLLPLLDAVGFARDIVEDFYHPFRSLLSTRPSPAFLLSQFQDAETSNSSVVFLRLLTSAYLQVNADDFTPFLFSLEDDPRFFEGGVPTMQQFCSFHVEAVNKEADHIQITALTRALGIHTRILYLDQSSGENVEMHEFEAGSEEKLACALLYRPGHYDVIYQN